MHKVKCGEHPIFISYNKLYLLLLSYLCAGVAVQLAHGYTKFLSAGNVAPSVTKVLVFTDRITLRIKTCGSTGKGLLINKRFANKRKKYIPDVVNLPRVTNRSMANSPGI